MTATPLGRPRWSVVLWDYDGTLADTVPAILAAHHLAIAGLPGAIDDRTVLSRIGEPARRRFEAIVPERSAEAFARYSEVIGAIAPQETTLFPGVVELLTDLTALGARQAVVTSRPRAQVDPVLDLRGLRRLVSPVVGLEDTVRHKPDPAPLLHALNDLSAHPAEAVYVGDAVVDVEAARAAGVAAVAVTWGAGTPDALSAAGPDVVVATVRELRERLLATDWSGS